MSVSPEPAGLPAGANGATPIVQEPVRYVGLITRGIAFALDAAVINVVAIFVEVGAALILSIFHLPHDVKNLIVAAGGVIYVVWIVGYFVGFWSGTGQTPGNRVMQIRVLGTDGRPIKPLRGIVRCVGLLLAALPLFAGYLMIPFTRRRRGLQDYIARTVVVEQPSLSLAQVRQAQMRARKAAEAPVADGAEALARSVEHSSESGDDGGSTRVQA